MTWTIHRSAPGQDDLADVAAFAAEFGAGVDRSFPIDEAALARIRGVTVGTFLAASRASNTRRIGRPVGRRLTLALVATIALLLMGSVSAEAAPGGPFYPIRLAIETARLPSIDAPAGWEARLDRLQVRIDEALAAARRDDSRAIEAALVEYRVELSGMTLALGDSARRSELLPVLERDRGAVSGLAQTFPGTVAGLLIADIDTLLQAGVPATADPHANGTTGNPHAGGTIGNPHAGGTDGDPATGGATGNPHATGNPTGDPHSGGATGNPHQGGTTTGNPHADGTTGNPHGGSDPTGNPHVGG